MAGEPLTLRAQFAGLGISTERKTDAAQQRGGLGGVGVKAHPAKTVVGLSQMRLGRSRIGKDEFHDAGEVLDLEERMTQAEFGDRAPGRTDHPSCRGIVAAIRLQDGLAFLATVGSTAPFVGLFGTVWGIYHALTAIGIAGQASIDKVAGPVGEALIMTAIGLAVAVPAVLGYNWLVRRNKVTMESVRRFGADLHGVLMGARLAPAQAAR